MDFTSLIWNLIPPAFKSVEITVGNSIKPIDIVFSNGSIVLEEIFGKLDAQA